jgi:hypothetical protein
MNGNQPEWIVIGEIEFLTSKSLKALFVSSITNFDAKLK